jgi:hypothetical protein
MLNKIIDLIFQGILFTLFFLVLTPIGFIARALGKDMLSRVYDKDAPTYWITRS